MDSMPTSPEPWIALVHIEPDVPGNPEWIKDFGNSSTGAFVNVLALAHDGESFKAAVAADLAGNNWRATDFEDLESFFDRSTNTAVAQELFDLADELAASGEPQFATWHLYFDEDTSTTEWLRLEAQSAGRSEPQIKVLDALAGMLDTLETSGLDGVSIEEDDEEITVVLAHEDESSFDFGIMVGRDHVVIDHGYGHLHFSQDSSPEWMDDAVQFIFNALQGGVKVEAWEKKGELERSRTFIKLEGGEEWGEYSAWALEPNPSFDDTPTETKIISFI